MPLKYDREYWLGRAEEMRALAGMMSNRRDAQNMLGVAESNVQLADHVAVQAELSSRTVKTQGETKGALKDKFL